MTGSEHVVLLDATGRAVGTAPKADVHHASTPLHLAFSCHVLDGHGRALLTRRAKTKATWPGVWSNACCGHPQVGETLRGAVARRVEEELGVAVVDLRVALADFAYRAVMDDGTVEHELCPVFVARIEGDPRPDPDEVGDTAWVGWDALVARAVGEPGSLSPWSVEQIRLLSANGPGGHDSPLLDAPIRLGEAVLPNAVAPAGSLDAALAPVVGPVERLLDDHLSAKATALDALDPRLRHMTGEIRGLVGAGGKRLRPAFVYWGHRSTGAAHDDGVLLPGAAVELLHTFALLHDDVMDRSATRRGRPAAHVALASNHRAAALDGDPGWFGASAAILTGDLADVWADELLAGAPFPAEALARARRVFHLLREEVIAGQYLDLLVAADGGADEHRVRQVALLKSARYTVTRPLQLGAALATDVPGCVRDALTTYGDAVGLAFQLRDDVLGLFGDPATTGKSTLDDLREGKRTLLVLRALQLAGADQRRELRAALGDAGVDEEAAARARAVITESGALASVEALIADRYAVAVDAVAVLPDEPRRALVALADLAARRSS